MLKIMQKMADAMNEYSGNEYFRSFQDTFVNAFQTDVNGKKPLAEESLLFVKTG